MKKIFLFLFIFMAATFFAHAQNVGIGITTPTARLHVKDSAVLFSAVADIPGTPGLPPQQGAGRRMMWYPNKAAFRIGYVNGSQWDQNNIGNYSFASGFSTTASQGYTTAMGFFSTASGAASTAIGNQTTAKAFSSLSIGSLNDNSDNPDPLNINSSDRIFQIGNGYGFFPGNAMTVLRNGNMGIGTLIPVAKLHVQDSSVVFSATGVAPLTTGNPPISGTGRRMMWYPDKAAFRAGYVGNNNWDMFNTGNYSAAFGSNTQASGLVSTALGNGTIASGENSLASGQFSIAFGLNSTAMGYYTTAPGTYATSLGYQANAQGVGSLATGYITNALGNYSTALGYFTSASHNSLSSGFQSFAYGNTSLAIGSDLVANSFAETVFGSQNTEYSPVNINSWNASDRLFVLGNGRSGNRSDALVVLKNGNTGIGTSTPGFPLNFANTLGDKISLYGSSGNNYGFGIQNNLLQIHASAVGEDVAFGYGSSDAFTETMRIRGNGNVGIGTNAPSQKLHVIGNICATGLIGACSDIRYKTNFLPINNALSTVLKLNGIYYYWDAKKFDDKGFSDARQIGFSAQEIERFYPEMVQTDAEGYKAVDYSRLTPVLVEAIKEQQHKIDNQQKQIDELKKLVEKLAKQ